MMRGVIEYGEPAPPTPIFLEVSRRQAFQALNEAGKLASVQAAAQTAIESLPEPQRTKAAIDWETASTFVRNWPTLLLIAGAAGISSTELDQLFEMAAQL